MTLIRLLFLVKIVNVNLCTSMYLYSIFRLINFKIEKKSSHSYQIQGSYFVNVVIV